MTTSPVAWTKALEEANALAAELLENGFSDELGTRIEHLLLTLQLSGKMTPWLDRRRRLAAALSFWASALALETDRIVDTPLLDEFETDDEGPPIMDTPDALERLMSGSAIDVAQVFDLRLGPERLLSLGLRHSRVVGGEINEVKVADKVDFDMTTFIGVTFPGLQVRRTLQASSAQFFGGSMTACKFGQSEFMDAVIRFAEFRKMNFGKANFENAELSFNPGVRLDSTEKQVWIDRWIRDFDLLDAGPVRFTDCVFKDEANFESAVLVDVEFTRCKLRRARFGGAILAHFDGANVLRAKFRDCDLGGADFEGAVNTDAVDFDVTSLRDVELPAATRFEP